MRALPAIAAKNQLIDRIAIHNAGRQAEQVFGHLLPSWASARDRGDTVSLIIAHEIRDTREMEKWIVTVAHSRERY